MRISYLEVVKVLAFLAIVPSSHAAISINSNDTVRTLDSCFMGMNGAEADAGSREALRRAGVKLVRFPAGEGGDYYDWKATTNAVTPLIASQFAKGIGAKLVMQTNALGGAAHTMNTSAAYVTEFVNYTTTNAMDVAFWEVGNEPEWETTIGTWDGTSAGMNWYWNKFNEHAPAIHAARPGTKVAGPVGTNTYFWRTQKSLQYFVAACNANADAISLHWYSGNDTTWRANKGFAQTWTTEYNYIRSQTQKPFYITEWAGLGDPGKVQNSLMDAYPTTALIQADVIGAFSKSIGLVGHCMFGSLRGIAPPGGWGLFGGVNDIIDYNAPGPQYFSLVLWSKMGRIVLNATNSNSPATTLSVWANKKSTGEVQLMVINKTKSPINETISFTGYNPLNKVVDVYEYRAASTDSTMLDYVYNGSSTCNPAAADLPLPTSVTCTGTSFTRSFPAYSGTVLDFTQKTTSITSQIKPALVDGITVNYTGASIVINGGASFAKSNVRATIFDVSGSQVASLAKPANSSQSIQWNPGYGATGAYVVRVNTAEREFPRTITILK